MLLKIRNIIIIYLLILVAFIIQSTIFSKFTILGCAPNLMLILTFCAGYTRGRVPGVLMGFFSGLCLDVFFSDVIGFNALVLLIIGYVSGIMNKNYNNNSVYTPLLILLGSDVFYCIVYYCAWFGLRGKFEIAYYAVHIILPEFLLTLIAGLIIYIPLSKLYRKLSYD